MVLVALVHALDTVDVKRLPLGIVGKVGVVVLVIFRNSVTFKIGFVTNVHAVSVTNLVKSRVVGVVAGAHHVHVIRFHYANIALHILLCHRLAKHGVAVVSVDTLDLDLFAVYVNNAALDLNLAYTNVKENDLILVLDLELVKIGILVTPEVRFFDLGDLEGGIRVTFCASCGYLVAHHIRERVF